MGSSLLVASGVGDVGVRVHDGVGPERILHIPPLPVGGEAVVEVPVHGLAQAVLPGGALLPAQRRQLLVADEVPADAVHHQACTVPGLGCMSSRLLA